MYLACSCSPSCINNQLLVAFMTIQWFVSVNHFPSVIDCDLFFSRLFPSHFTITWIIASLALLINDIHCSLLSLECLLQLFVIQQQCCEFNFEPAWSLSMPLDCFLWIEFQLSIIIIRHRQDFVSKLNLILMLRLLLITTMQNTIILLYIM